MSEAVVNAFIDSTEDWAHFHDCLVNAYWNVREGGFSDEECKEEFRKLSSGTQGIAIRWGLGDTVFRDEAYVEIQKREGITK